LNQAVSGEEANKIAPQTQDLINKMRNLSTIDFINDWKMVTLYIGINDLCRFCFDREKFAPKAYIANIQAALDLLYKQVPRLFVNLVPVVHVSMYADLNIGKTCTEMHTIECVCGINIRLFMSLK
jgi:phospholipase B1